MQYFTLTAAFLAGLVVANDAHGQLYCDNNGCKIPCGQDYENWCAVDVSPPNVNLKFNSFSKTSDNNVDFANPETMNKYELHCSGSNTKCYLSCPSDGSMRAVDCDPNLKVAEFSAYKTGNQISLVPVPVSN